jgi:UDPglucose--hexose-1-phosphate uridylyltransferase
MRKENNKATEFRHDLLNDDWVIVSPIRADRFKKKALINECPFCDIKNQGKPTLVYSNGKRKESNDLKDWTTIVIPNKYPLFSLKQKYEEKKEGIFYSKIKASGFHELVITKDHDKSLALLPLNKVKEVINCYQDRIIEYKKYDFAKNVVVFHNHGKEAGASQPHPHCQIVTVPLIDKEFRITLKRSEDYFKKNKKCIRCTIEKEERKIKKRIVFENEDFLVYVPFAPKFTFQMIISPKKHASRFEDITDKEKDGLAEALKEALHRLYEGLKNPPYNFYLHTAPLDKEYPYFHWYFSVFPRRSALAGFEMGIQMEVPSMYPEDQALFLRKQK